MYRPVFLFIIAGVILGPQRCLGATATTTQTLNVTINALAKLSAPSSSTLTHTGITFSPYTSSFTMNYRARTSPTGSGSITAKTSSDFTPSGGPTISSGALTYTCSGATLGASCSGTLTVSASSATGIVTLPASACTGGGGACSSSNPNATSLSFTLNDSPQAATGSYQVGLQFTASAL